MCLAVLFNSLFCACLVCFPHLFLWCFDKQQQQTHFTAHTHRSSTTHVLPRVSRYQMTYHSHCPNCLNQHSLLHFLLSNASSFCNPKVLKSPSTTSVHVFLGRPLDLGPETTKFIHCFTQSSSDFLCTWPNHRNLFLCNTCANTLNSQSAPLYLPVFYPIPSLHTSM